MNNQTWKCERCGERIIRNDMRGAHDMCRCGGRLVQDRNVLISKIELTSLTEQRDAALTAGAQAMKRWEALKAWHLSQDVSEHDLLSLGAMADLERGEP